MAHRTNREEEPLSFLTPRGYHGLVTEILSRRTPELIQQISREGATILDRSTVFQMMDAVADELDEFGWRDEEDLNPYGLQLEDLLGELSLLAQSLEDSGAESGPTSVRTID